MSKGRLTYQGVTLSAILELGFHFLGYISCWNSFRRKICPAVRTGPLIVLETGSNARTAEATGHKPRIHHFP